MDFGLKILQELDNNSTLQGLNPAGIRFINTHGLWMPISKELLTMEPKLVNESGQIYLEDSDYNIISIIIDNGEFLTCVVYDVIDQFSHDDANMYLHQYTLEDGTIVEERLQAINDGVLFLRLMDADGRLITEWSELEMELLLSL